MPLYSDEFLDALPTQTWSGLKRICDHFIIFDSSLEEFEQSDHYDEYLEALALIQSYVEAKGLNWNHIPSVKGREETIEGIRKVIHSINKEVESKLAVIKLEESKDRFKGHLTGAFLYQFSDGDLERIQTLLDVLRKDISASSALDPKHKQRVIDKLERLQKELHKKESDLDKYFGIAGEVMVLVGKAGEAALPWAKCVKEIIGIVWQAQLRFYELPSSLPMDIPMLPSRDETQE